MILIDFNVNNKDEEPKFITLVAYHISGYLVIDDDSCKLMLINGMSFIVYHDEQEMRRKLSPPKKEKVISKEKTDPRIKFKNKREFNSSQKYNRRD